MKWENIKQYFQQKYTVEDNGDYILLELNLNDHDTKRVAICKETYLNTNWISINSVIESLLTVHDSTSTLENVLSVLEQLPFGGVIKIEDSYYAQYCMYANETNGEAIEQMVWVIAQFEDVITECIEENKRNNAGTDEDDDEVFDDDDDGNLIEQDENENVTDDEKAQGMASKMGKNASQADIDNVAAKLDSMNRGPLAAIWDKIQAMWRAFNSPATPTHIKALIIGGLIYAVSPLDVVPDFIPVVGLMDDYGVLGVILQQLYRVGIATAVAYTVIKFLDIKRLKEELKKKQAELERETQRKALSAKILECLETENGHENVRVGLYDEKGLIGTHDIESEKIDKNEIYKGRELSLPA